MLVIQDIKGKLHPADGNEKRQPKHFHDPDKKKREKDELRRTRIELVPNAWKAFMLTTTPAPQLTVDVCFGKSADNVQNKYDSQP